MDARATCLIRRLTDFAVEKGLIEAQDIRFFFNRLLDAMGMDAPQEGECPPEPIAQTATPILDQLVQIACERGIALDSARGATCSARG